MTRETIIFAAALGLATALAAHPGVKDPGVKARMDTMVALGTATAVLGDMTKGKRAFDPAEALAARAALIAAFREVPDKFEEPHTDPTSEARPIIWERFDDFLDKNAAAVAAAQAMDVQTLESLRAAMGPLGASCGACHKTYRIKK